MYYALSLNTGRLPGSIFLNTFLLNIVEIPANLVTIFVMEKYGGRVTLGCFTAFAGISSFAMIPFMFHEGALLLHFFTFCFEPNSERNCVLIYRQWVCRDSSRHTWKRPDNGVLQHSVCGNSGDLPDKNQESSNGNISFFWSSEQHGIFIPGWHYGGHIYGQKHLQTS